MKATIHSITCDASLDAIYRVISNSNRWPDVYEPCHKVEQLKKSNDFEVIRINADVNGVEMQWESQRTFFRDIHGIDFQIITPFSLLKSMHGRWRVIPLEVKKSLLFIEHFFQVKENVTGLVAGINTPQEALNFTMQGIDRNSIKELSSIKVFAEQNNYQNTKS